MAFLKQLAPATLKAEMDAASRMAQLQGDNSPGWYSAMIPSATNPGDTLSWFHPNGQTVNVPGVGTFQFAKEIAGTNADVKAQAAWLRQYFASRPRR